MSRRSPGYFRRTLRRLSDPAWIGWPYFWATLIAWVVSAYPAVFRSDLRLTGEIVGIWLVIVVAGQLSIFAVLVLAKRLWLPLRFSRSHPVVAVLSIVAAGTVGLVAARTVASWFFGERDGIVVGLEYVPFVLLVMTVTGSAIVTVVDYRREVVKLLTHRASLEESISQAQQRLQQDREEIFRGAESIIDMAIASLEGSRSEAVTVLRTASEGVFRPLSHDLVRSGPVFIPSPMKPPQPRGKEIYANLMAKSFIAPRLMAFLFLFLFWRLSITEYEPPSRTLEGPQAAGLTVTVDLSSLVLSFGQLATVFFATLVVSVLVDWIVRLVIPRVLLKYRPIIHVFSVMGVVVGSQVLIVGFVGLLGGPTGAIQSLTASLLFFVSAALVTSALGVTRAIEVVHRDVTAQLEKVSTQLKWSLRRLHQEIWHQRRELGVLIHGRFRTALISSAMQLSTRGEEVTDEDIEEIRRRLERVKDQSYPSLVHSDIATALGEVSSLWRETCVIDVEVNDETHERMSRDVVAATITLNIVDEAIANAMRHADPRTILVSISSTSDSAVIVVKNDGAPPRKDSSPGLGSALLDEVALEWNLSSTPEGTTFQARIPLT